MATMEFLGGTVPNNRRRGLVYAKQGNIYTARTANIPLNPLTFIQNRAQVTLASAAAFWYRMSSAQQNNWSFYSVPPSNGYADFLQQSQRLLTWGLPLTANIQNDNSGNGTTLVNFGTDPATLLGFANFIAPHSLVSGREIWFRAYWQVSSLQEVYFSGFSSNTPGNPAPYPYTPPSGYTFFGSMGPFPDQFIGAVELGAATIAGMGRPPTPSTYPPGLGHGYGSQSDVQGYWTDQYGACMPFPDPLPPFTARPLVKYPDGWRGERIATTLLVGPPGPTFFAARDRSRRAPLGTPPPSP